MQVVTTVCAIAAGVGAVLLIVARLLASQWREEGKRNKRFYKLSDDGRRMLTQLLAEWRSIDTSLNNILSESSHGFARQVSAGS